MSTQPTPTPASTWINLLLGIGGALGGSFATNPALQGLIATAIAATQNLITTLTNKTAGQPIAAPVFATVFQAAIGVLVAENKITATEAAELTKAVTATLAADQAAQIVIDPTVLATPLPTLA